MAKVTQCQSCGMPIDKKTSAGTESDGTASEKYCHHCYQNGSFTLDFGFDDMYEYNLKRFQESDMNKIQKFFLYKMYTKKFMAKLDRWK
ncbi:zinc ribbon domain-containing protein [Staphylococcus pseudoxylosus]|uniref:zinc ribbon domain-containing protein n=1 Tax=Staphylococcus pseudoxylosus TaxID=2282419 RepID=UPI00398AD157